MSVDIPCIQWATSTSVYTIPRVPEVYVRFYALNGLKMDKASPHPAATLPVIRLHVIDSGSPKNVFHLQIFGDYVILELWVDMGPGFNFFVDVYNWKTGQMVSVRIISIVTRM